jgi:cyclophilin family peptidyl-prolyl cis-trans isomerase
MQRVALVVFGLIALAVVVFFVASMGPSGPNPVVVIKTSMGDIVAELYQDKAPITVKNFLDYVDSKHYDGTIFHRVIPDFMIQGGGFAPGMVKEKTTFPPIRNEASNGLLNLRGTLAMARTNDPDSATAQFFINVEDNKGLDRTKSKAGYAVFGKVIDGMDVVDRIRVVPTEKVDVHENVPVKDVMIISVRRVESAQPASK